MVACTFNLSTQEAEVAGSLSLRTASSICQGTHDYIDRLSQKKKKNGCVPLQTVVGKSYDFAWLEK